MAKLSKSINSPILFDMCEKLIKGEKVYYNIQYGSGRRTSYKTYRFDIEEIFNNRNLEYGNDAPRGGAHGDFVIFKKKRK